jgi:hypothetical protein
MVIARAILDTFLVESCRERQIGQRLDRHDPQRQLWSHPRRRQRDAGPARRSKLIVLKPARSKYEETAHIEAAETPNYARRMHGAETPFAHIKGVMGVRQFLMRGLENVRTEWRWVCTAFNFQKLLKAVAALRASLLQGTAKAVV